MVGESRGAAPSLQFCVAHMELWEWEAAPGGGVGPKDTDDRMGPWVEAGARGRALGLAQG